jgi:spore coat protein CotF
MNAKDMKPLVNNPNLWNLLDKHLQDMYNNRHKEMDNLSKIEDFYKAQGYCQAITSLRNLKENANVN